MSALRLRAGACGRPCMVARAGARWHTPHGSEGFSHPPPELFGYNQVRDAVFGDAEYAYCGGERSESSDDHSSDDDDEAEAEGEAAVAGA